MGLGRCHFCMDYCDMHEFLQITVLTAKIGYKLAKLTLFCGLGLISPLIKIVYLDFGGAVLNATIIYSWFLACGYIYPVINNFWIKLIHLVIVITFMYQQGQDVFKNNTNPFQKEKKIKNSIYINMKANSLERKNRK